MNNDAYPRGRGHLTVGNELGAAVEDGAHGRHVEPRALEQAPAALVVVVAADGVENEIEPRFVELVQRVPIVADRFCPYNGTNFERPFAAISRISKTFFRKD